MPTGIYKRKERIPAIIRLESKTIPIPECGCLIFLGSTSPDGYGRLRYKGKWINAHRVAWELYKGSIPAGKQVLHRCDTPSCVNPRHLFLGTNYDNIQDKIKKGRLRCGYGEKQGSSKLTEQQIIEIRTSKKTSTLLSQKYSVSITQICNIKNYKQWKHVAIPGVSAKSKTV